MTKQLHMKFVSWVHCSWITAWEFSNKKKRYQRFPAMQTEESSSVILFPFIGEPEAEILLTAPILSHLKNWNIQSIKRICNCKNTLCNRQMESFNLFNSLKKLNTEKILNTRSNAQLRENGSKLKTEIK